MNREAEKLGIDMDMPVLLGYTGTEDTLLQKYKEESSDFYGNRQLPSTIVSAVVGTHAGPGAVALAFFSK
jgi:fatty acid-binding protein DegV